MDKKAFYVEKSGIVNAKNISEIGDWREYIKA